MLTTRMSVMVALVVALPALMAAVPQRQPATESAPAAPGGEPSLVPVTLNVVVTDKRGRPVPTLKAADFQLDDNGETQTIGSVELRTPTSLATDAAAPITSDVDEIAAAREPSTRVIALFLDEFNVSPGANTDRVREAATRFINEYVRPRDLIYVLKPMGPVNAIRFTRDRAVALAAVTGFAGRKGDYEPRSPFESEFFGRTPGAVESARTQIVTTGLRELTLKMGELRPSRGALLLVSEGFSRPGGVEKRRLPDWQGLARAAGHFNLPIYTLDPGDPEPPAADADSAPAPDRNQVTLQSLATQTGGEAVADARDLLPSLARISRDLDTYYVLTYTPTKPTDGRFHPIVVRTTRKDTQVRVPSGYWSPLSTEWRTWLNRPLTTAPALPTRAVRRSRLVDLWSGFERDSDGRLQLVLSWEPTPLGMTSKLRPTEVSVKASGPDGTALFDGGLGPVDPDSPVPGTDRVAIPVTTGRVQLDLIVKGGDGATIETAAQDLDVPVARGNGPVLLAPQIVRARTVREFKELAALATAAPSPGRVFSRGERLLIRVPAYNPDGSDISVAAAVVNLRGQKIRELTRTPADGSVVLPQFESHAVVPRAG